MRLQCATLGPAVRFCRIGVDVLTNFTRGVSNNFADASRTPDEVRDQFPSLLDIRRAFASDR